MATPRQLENPPIREALVDIKTNGPIDPAAFRELAHELSGRFPQAQDRNQIEAKFEVGKTGGIAAAAKQVGLVGIFLKSTDGRRVAQFRRDGFTLNQVGHYTSAEDLFAEALDLWPRFVRVAKPESIASVSVRYINEMILPFRQGDDLRRFLLVAPDLPAGMPELVGQFQLNLVLRDEPTGAIIKVTQSMANGRGGGRYVLDINPSLAGPKPIDTLLINDLQRLRAVKNTVFFSMVTDEALVPYDKRNASSNR